MADMNENIMKQSMNDVFAVTNRLWMLILQSHTASFGTIRREGKVGAYSWELWHESDLKAGGEATSFEGAIYSIREQWLLGVRDD